MLSRMCRNIRPLFNFEPPATDEEIRAAALQYVRKVSGTNKPSAKNEAVFEAAIDAIEKITRELVAEVAFSEWTDDGRLRHPSFQGLRLDKPARDVVREAPARPAAREPAARARRGAAASGPRRGARKRPAR